MAPKRKGKKVVGVVRRTTRKVVQETVRVAVVDNDTNNGNTQPSQISLPDFEGETEDLQEARDLEMMGLGTEEEEEAPITFIGGSASTPPSSTTTRRMSTRRTIIVEGKIPEGTPTKLQVPVEEPAVPKETVAVRAEGLTEERRPEERPQSTEENQESPENRIEQEEVARESETQREKKGPVSEQEAKENDAREKPKAEKGKGEKKARSKQSRGRRKRKEEVGNEEYRRYVFKVLKQVHPGMRISGQAMMVLNGYMNDMFERLADEAAKLSRYTGRLTLSSREIQGAVRLVLPGELGQHAIAEGAKAVSNYMSHDASR